MLVWTGQIVSEHCIIVHRHWWWIDLISNEVRKEATIWLSCHFGSVTDCCYPVLQRPRDNNLLTIWDSSKKKTLFTKEEWCCLLLANSWRDLANKVFQFLLLGKFVYNDLQQRQRSRSFSYTGGGPEDIVWLEDVLQDGIGIFELVIVMICDWAARLLVVTPHSLVMKVHFRYFAYVCHGWLGFLYQSRTKRISLKRFSNLLDVFSWTKNMRRSIGLYIDHEFPILNVKAQLREF